jgi:hypothetical protein
MVEHHSNKIQNVIQSELFKAKSSIKIVVAWFTNDLLFQPLVLKQQAGVKVEIILNRDEINDSNDNNINFDELVNVGGIVRWNETKQLMHDKFCIIDDSIVIYGSYNWTNKAEYNEESITVSRNEPETIKFYLGKFEKLLEKYPPTKINPSHNNDSNKNQLKHQPQFNTKDNSNFTETILLEQSQKPYIKKNGIPYTNEICSELNFYTEINIVRVGYRSFKSKFGEDVIIAKSYGSYYFINPNTFLPINNVEFVEYRAWKDGLMWLRIEWKWGLYDTFKETFLLSPILDNIFDKSLAWRNTAVKLNGNWGLVDEHGKFVLECKYDLNTFNDLLVRYV